MAVCAPPDAGSGAAGSNCAPDERDAPALGKGGGDDTCARGDGAALAGDGWLSDVFVGALSSGVNATTLVLLNVVVGAALGSILLLLALSAYGNPELVPHVVVLLVLGLGLWASLNWFICNVGLADPKQQRQQIFGVSAEGTLSETEAEPGMAGAAAEAKKKR
uniref:Uncharacterized protein n=1 Tax=Chlamydomonas euryale TaxID=1486919 RepID=A0A7R9VBD4_9CHLO